CVKHSFLQPQRPAQKTARPGGVDYKTGAQRQRCAAARARQHWIRLYEIRRVERSLLKQFHSELCGLPGQELVEVRPKPVRVGNAVVRAGASEQFLSPIERRFPGLAERVMVKREAALQAAGDFRVGLLPRTPFG